MRNQLSLCNALVLLCASIMSFASTPVLAQSLNIGEHQLNPEQLITGEWLGEADMGGVQQYGVQALAQLTAFIPEPELRDVLNSLLAYQTAEDIHALHLYGTDNANEQGSESFGIETLYGYSVIVGDERSGALRIETFELVEGQDQSPTATTFQAKHRFSQQVVGALDCQSAAQLALLLTPANSQVVSLTLGKDNYLYAIESEERFSEQLSIETRALARERALP